MAAWSPSKVTEFVPMLEMIKYSNASPSTLVLMPCAYRSGVCSMLLIGTLQRLEAFIRKQTEKGKIGKFVLLKIKMIYLQFNWHAASCLTRTSCENRDYQVYRFGLYIALTQIFFF